MIGPTTVFYNKRAKLIPEPFEEIYKGVDYSAEAFLTVIITTYNRPLLLKEAIESLICQNTTCSFNILITDNNSEENLRLSREYIEGLSRNNIRYIRNLENLGMFGNMNQGLVLAETEYVAFLHDDDLYDSSFVSNVWSKINSRKDIKALHVGVTKIINGKKGHIIERGKLKKYKDWQMLFEGPGAPTGLVVKRDIAVNLGGFNIDFHPTSDYCFGCEISSTYHYYKYSKTLCYYRVSENESMKVDTLKLFVNNDFFLRRHILNKYSVPNVIQNTIQSYLVSDQIIVLRNNYNKNFDYHIPHEFGVTGKASYLEYLLCRLYIEIHIRIITLLSMVKNSHS